MIGTITILAQDLFVLGFFHHQLCMMEKTCRRFLEGRCRKYSECPMRHCILDEDGDIVSQVPTLFGRTKPGMLRQQADGTWKLRDGLTNLLRRYLTHHGSPVIIEETERMHTEMNDEMMLNEFLSFKALEGSVCTQSVVAHSCVLCSWARLPTWCVILRCDHVFGVAFIWLFIMCESIV